MRRTRCAFRGCDHACAGLLEGALRCYRRGSNGQGAAAQWRPAVGGGGGAKRSVQGAVEGRIAVGRSRGQRAMQSLREPQSGQPHGGASRRAAWVRRSSFGPSRSHCPRETFTGGSLGAKISAIGASPSLDALCEGRLRGLRARERQLQRALAASGSDDDGDGRRGFGGGWRPDGAASAILFSALSSSAASALLCSASSATRCGRVRVRWVMWAGGRWALADERAHPRNAYAKKAMASPRLPSCPSCPS